MIEIEEYRRDNHLSPKRDLTAVKSLIAEYQRRKASESKR